MTAAVRPFALALALSCALTGSAQTAWQRPPQPILDVLHAPELPTIVVSPDGGAAILARPRRYPPIADLARPMLRLAGVRVDPQSNAIHAEAFFDDLRLTALDGSGERPIALPADARVSRIRWSADGRRFAFANRTADALELWVGDVASAEVRRVPGLRLNPVLGSEIQWMRDQRSLLVKRIPPDRGPAPQRPAAPAGPRVEESAGATPSSTYEARDLLTGPHDAALFEHHALSQLAVVDADTLAVAPVGEPSIISSVTISPDGRFLLVERLRPPWSYLREWGRFPKDVELRDRSGALVRVVASLPLADRVPIQGVAEGPRNVEWRQTAPATLAWTEALDGGDPARKAAERDRVLLLDAPFDGPPREIHRAAHRVQQAWWGDGGLLIVGEYERERRWRHAWALDVDAPKPSPRKIVDLSANDRYASPGWPLLRTRPDGTRVLLQDGDAIFLSGDGATPKGDRPFLDRFSLRTLQAERLFRSDPSGIEQVVDVLDARARRLLTRKESPQDPPNYFVRQLGRRHRGAPGEAAWTSTARQVSSFADPTPQLRGITKRIVTYQRADGVPLSFTLYLPPGHVEGTRLPTVAWAYPLEYSDPATAGQVSGTDREFTRLAGASPLFFLLAGYAVLADVTMPVIGDPETAYDSFIPQLVASARAAVDKAVELGVTDPDRVGVGGHSHGALMTATLLAHSDIFRAGIARSGAYNHTLRPFGFQRERRTLYEATETYVRLSPLVHAAAIDEPLLLVHGEADYNPGTVPLQSEKLFEAVRGTGGTVRLVMLPHESHGYASREGVEQVIAEQIEWFDRFVKHAPSRAVATGP